MSSAAIRALMAKYEEASKNVSAVIPFVDGCISQVAANSTAAFEVTISGEAQDRGEIESEVVPNINSIGDLLQAIIDECATKLAELETELKLALIREEKERILAENKAKARRMGNERVMLEK